MKGFVFEEATVDQGSFATGGIASFGELTQAEFDAARKTSNVNSEIVARQEYYDRVIDTVQEETGQTLENPYRIGFWKTTLNVDAHLRAQRTHQNQRDIVRRDAVFEFEEKYENIRRNYGASFIGPGGESVQVHEDVRQQTKSGNLLPYLLSAEAGGRGVALEANRVAEDTRNRSQSGVGSFTAGLAGGAGAAFTDPVQIGASFLGPTGRASTLLKTARNGALVTAAQEAALQPTIAAWHKELGLEYTAGDAIQNTFFAAVTGGVLAGTGRYANDQIKTSRQYKAAKARLESLPDEHPLRQLGSNKREDVIATASRIEEFLPDEGKELLASARAEARTDAARPDHIDIGEHRTALDEARRAAESPDLYLPPIVDDAPPIRGHDFAQPSERFGGVFEVEGLPVRQTRLDVTKLETDAQSLQYKSGGDADGVTERLSGVEQWNPVLANEFIVWERADGRLVVADGHQRSGLGRRLVESGAEEEIQVNANVLRERDGWTAGDVRAVAAKKNIAEGSGDVLDTAQAIRDRPDIVDKSLPLSSEHLRNARAIARLDENAYGLVRNGILQPSHAAVIGRYAPKEAHNAVAEAIQQARPSNALEAQVVVREALEAGFRVDVQESLFGADVHQRSILPEKIKLVTAITKKLRSDKKVFGVLAKEAERIEAAGNTLARGENAKLAASAGQVEDLLVRLATRRGGISDRLNDAARAIGEGETTRAKAAAELSKALRDDLDAGGIESLLDAPSREPAPRKVFDEPDGPPVRDLDAEADALSGELEATPRDPNTNDLFATVPDADGTPIRDGDAEIKKADAVLKRFEGCVVR